MRFLATVVLAACLASCGQADYPDGADADEGVGQTQVSAAPSIRIAGREVRLLNGLGQLHLPEGWREKETVGRVATVEAERYPADSDYWAECQISSTSGPNFRGASQSDVNARREEMSNQIAADLGEQGLSVDVSHTTIADDISAAVIRYARGGAEYVIHMFAIANGFGAHVVSIYCESASPDAERDRKDIEDLLNSFRFDRR